MTCRPHLFLDARRLAGACAACAIGLVMAAAPERAFAQSDGWRVDAAPLYLWASETDGKLGVNNRSVPIFMSFGDAVDHLSAVFTFHVEAQKGAGAF